MSEAKMTSITDQLVSAIQTQFAQSYNAYHQMLTVFLPEEISRIVCQYQHDPLRRSAWLVGEELDKIVTACTDAIIACEAVHIRPLLSSSSQVERECFVNDSISWIYDFTRLG